MQEVIMYTSNTCPYCVLAKRLLAQQGVIPKEINVDNAPGKRAQMTQITKRRSVPQIFVGDIHVGGYDDLSAFARTGQLETLLTPGRALLTPYSRDTAP